ncbi:MAG: SPOR domain-containing protein [Longimicrobiales bacterium]
MRFRLASFLVFVLLAAPAAGAGQVPTLERVDSLITAGEYGSGRAILDQWWSARDEFDVPGSDMARALMLRAQLATDLETAEPDYLAVILGYPTSPHAPEALLRLGQGLLANGDATRAAAYLERLVADYPGRPQRTVGLLWLARASTAARRPEAACSAARQGLQATNDPDLRTMLQVEAGASCTVRSDRPDQPEPAQAATGEFAVQTGAFRYRRSADELIERLRQAGHQPRIVRVPGSDLLRVRVGRFESSDPAGRLVTELRDQGFDAVVVRDAHEERQP